MENLRRDPLCTAMVDRKERYSELQGVMLEGRGEVAAVDAHTPGGKLVRNSVAQGAATTVYAATAPELEGRGGVYLEDCHVADDPGTERALWAASEAMVGERFS